MDDILQQEVLTGDFARVAAVARKRGKISVLRNLNLKLTSEVKYLYRLRRTRGKVNLFGSNPEELVQQISQAIDTNIISLDDVGFRQDRGGAWISDPSRLYNPEYYWKLSRVPTIDVNGQLVQLSHSLFTPHFKVKWRVGVNHPLNFKNMCEKGGFGSNRLKNLEEQRKEAQRIRGEQEKERSLGKLRNERINVFKETLKRNVEAAQSYRDSFEGKDPEFARITGLLLQKKLAEPK